MSFAPLKSSNIAGVAYDSDTRILVVQFINGGRYAHVGVPAEEYAGFFNTDSPGGYYNKRIAPHFNFVKLPAIKNSERTDAPTSEEKGDPTAVDPPTTHTSAPLGADPILGDRHESHDGGGRSRAQHRALE